MIDGKTACAVAPVTVLNSMRQEVGALGMIFVPLATLWGAIGSRHPVVLPLWHEFALAVRRGRWCQGASRELCRRSAPRGRI